MTVFDLKVTLPDGLVFEERVTITDTAQTELCGHPLVRQAFLLLKCQFEEHLGKHSGEKAA